MTIVLEDSDLSRRIDALVARTTLTRQEILRGALAEGRSVAWLEQWVSGVEDGLAQADRGEFASQSDIDALLGR